MAKCLLMGAAACFSSLAVCASVGCLLSARSFAQEPGQISKRSKADREAEIVNQPTAQDAAVIQSEHVEDLASRLLHHISYAAPMVGPCKILVTNFVFRDGNTSAYGKEVADALSSLIAAKDQTVEVVDRSLLQNLIQIDRISSKLQSSEPGASWLGRELGATVVVVGEMRKIRNDFVEVSARFLNAMNADQIGPSAEVILLVKQPEDLSPTEGLGPLPLLPRLSDTFHDEVVYRLGQGVSAPSCYFMPAPPMTGAAGLANFSGSILAEGVIGTDGTMKGVRIVQGAPFGLSETVIKTLRTWKCKPGMLDGKAVATLVPLEVTFHSFLSH